MAIKRNQQLTYTTWTDLMGIMLGGRKVRLKGDTLWYKILFYFKIKISEVYRMIESIAF